MDWTEIQTLISVAKNGSLSGAARELQVNHSTILRRIQSFEEKHHVTVFVRESQGYRLSRHGRALLQNFDELDSAMLGLQRRIVDYDSGVQGRLLVTTTETLFTGSLQAALFSFARAFPRIDLDLMVSNQPVDMNQLEADVAIRPAPALPDGFTGEPLFSSSFAFYAPREMAQRLTGKDPFAWPQWVGFSGVLATARVGQILAERMTHKPVLTANSFLGVARAANNGLGIALLPDFVGDAEDNLVKITSADIFTTDVYMMTPNDLSQTRRVQAFMRFIAERLKLD